VKVLVIGAAIAVAGFWLLQSSDRAIVGFNASKQSESEPLPVATPKVKNTQANVPRSLKLRVTLDTPADLKVKQGESVSQGQVISDRASVRKQLMGEQRSLLIQLGQLKERGVTSVRPMPSFAVEQAKIEAAKLKVNQAKWAIADFWVHLPYTQMAWNLLPLEAERGKLITLEAQLSQAQIEYKLTVAQLQAAREVNQLAVYKDGRQQDASRQQEQVLAQLKEIEDKFARLEVRSPYPGTIKKIKWLGQTNQELLVEATIAVGASH
jgi:biotin carboxyl carrier protein